jgi:phage FluMu gp28-like protein
LTEALPKLSGDMPEVLRGRDLEGVLLGYQQRSLLLCSSTPLAVIEKSRRIGLTWALAALAVLGAAKQKSAGGMNVWYMGYDLDMAREFVDTCAMWAEAFGYRRRGQVDEELFEDDKGQAFRRPLRLRLQDRGAAVGRRDRCAASRARSSSTRPPSTTSWPR